MTMPESKHGRTRRLRSRRRRQSCLVEAAGWAMAIAVLVVGLLALAQLGTCGGGT